jgi:DNA end-binding protein Ku
VSARAIWKGELLVGKHEVPVKMYSAVEDRTVHFKLLDRRKHEHVEQEIVRKDTGNEVPREDRRKAFPLDDGRAVILQLDDLASVEPPPSRDIHLCRFVPAGLLADPWFDRPYWLGPDEDADAYFALARAVADRQVDGIARWVMRKKRYLGALRAEGDYLMLITLRRSDQVLALPAVQPARTRTPTEAELKLATQLVESIAGDFDPGEWHNEYRERLCTLISAKLHGEKVKPLKQPKRAPSASLEDALRASLAGNKERKRA